MTSEMTLREKQSRFVQMVGSLIDYAYRVCNFELTFGDAYRDPRCPYGSEVSLHHDRLAIDLNLFIRGQYRSDAEAHETLGKYWESIGGTWGGRWGDANHYSLAHGGRK